MRVREAIKGCAECARLFERMAAEEADPWIKDAFKKQAAVYLRLIEQGQQQGLYERRRERVAKSIFVGSVLIVWGSLAVPIVLNLLK